MCCNKFPSPKQLSRVYAQREQIKANCYPKYDKPSDEKPLHNQNFSVLQIKMNQGTLQDSKITVTSSFPSKESMKSREWVFFRYQIYPFNGYLNKG